MGTCPPVAFDVEGAVWLACPDGKPGVLLVRRGGEIVERVELDAERCAVMRGGDRAVAGSLRWC